MAYDVEKTDKQWREELSREEYAVLRKAGTERAFKGEYTDTETTGVYRCKACQAKLFESGTKFHSGCGWPSFVDEIAGAVRHLPDADGRRTEIVCAACDAHLGHVFAGERLTLKNTRHCVNSISLRFIPEERRGA